MTLRERAIAYNRVRAAEREELIAGRTAIVEAARLRADLAEARENLSVLFARFQALENVVVWSEQESGFGFKVGDEVRHFARMYRCVKAHTKALLRSPLNSEFWDVAEYS